MSRRNVAVPTSTGTASPVTGDAPAQGADPTGASVISATSANVMTAPSKGEAGDEWLDRAQIARLARVSEQTINRDIKRENPEFRLSPNGAKLFRVADFVRLGRLRAEDIPTGLTAAQAVEVQRLTEQVARLTAETGELRGRLEEQRAAHDLAVSQMKEKDAQLKAANASLQRVITLLVRSAA